MTIFKYYALALYKAKNVYFQHMSEGIVKVGIGVMVWKDGKILAGRRKNAHGVGELAWPGGHFEYMESFEECARREVREETGVEIENIRFLRVMNLKKYPPKHYVDIGLMADWKSGEPQVLEPDKVGSWGWYTPKEMQKETMFQTQPTYFEALETGKNFWDE